MTGEGSNVSKPQVEGSAVSHKLLGWHGHVYTEEINFLDRIHHSCSGDEFITST